MNIIKVGNDYFNADKIEVGDDTINLQDVHAVRYYPDNHWVTVVFDDGDNVYYKDKERVDQIKDRLDALSSPPHGRLREEIESFIEKTDKWIGADIDRDNHEEGQKHAAVAIMNELRKILEATK